MRRILRHLWTDDARVRRLLPPAALERLAGRIAASERLHTGEIQVHVEAALPLSYLWRNARARERAITLFGQLGVWDTEQNNGVLIYLLLAENAIELVADRGLVRAVPVGTWETLVARMAETLRAGRFEEALQQAVDEVSALLVRHFPLAPGQPNPNELPDLPSVGPT